MFYRIDYESLRTIITTSHVIHDAIWFRTRQPLLETLVNNISLLLVRSKYVLVQTLMVRHWLFTFPILMTTQVDSNLNYHCVHYSNYHPILEPKREFGK